VIGPDTVNGNTHMVVPIKAGSRAFAVQMMEMVEKAPIAFRSFVPLRFIASVTSQFGTSPSQNGLVSTTSILARTPCTCGRRRRFLFVQNAVNYCVRFSVY
jgi:hypothetical protein